MGIYSSEDFSALKDAYQKLKELSNPTTLRVYHEAREKIIRSFISGGSIKNAQWPPLAVLLYPEHNIPEPSIKIDNWYKVVRKYGIRKLTNCDECVKRVFTILRAKQTESKAWLSDYQAKVEKSLEAETSQVESQGESVDQSNEAPQGESVPRDEPPTQDQASEDVPAGKVEAPALPPHPNAPTKDKEIRIPKSAREDAKKKEKPSSNAIKTKAFSMQAGESFITDKGLKITIKHFEGVNVVCTTETNEQVTLHNEFFKTYKKA